MLISPSLFMKLTFQIMSDLLNETTEKVLEMIVTLQEHHGMNQSGIPTLNKYVVEIMPAFALQIEVGKN